RSTILRAALHGSLPPPALSYLSRGTRHTSSPRDLSSDVALPISRVALLLTSPARSQSPTAARAPLPLLFPNSYTAGLVASINQRSEERRVGKECRPRW